MENLGFKSRNSFKVLKYQVNAFNTSNNDEHNLVYKILDSLKEMKLYKESTLEKVYTLKEVKDKISPINTISTIDEYKYYIRRILPNKKFHISIYSSTTYNKTKYSYI